MRKRFSKVMGFGATITLLALAAACGSSSNSSSDSVAVENVENTEVKVEAVGRKKITFVTVLLADANWSAVNSCFNDRAVELGYSPSIIAPSSEKNDIPGMLDLIEQAVISKPDALVVVPLNPPSFNEVLAKAKDAEVPVFTMTFDSEKPEDRIAFVGTDFGGVGRQGADVLAGAMGEKAVIGVLSAGADVAPHVIAIDEFKRYIGEKYPNMKVVAEDFIPIDYVKAAEIARGMILAHPDINAFWSPDGRGGIAAANAMRDLNRRGDFTIVGADHLPQVVADLEAKDQFASVNFVSCNWGRGVVDKIDEYFKTGTVVEPVNYVDNVLWTQENP